MYPLLFITGFAASALAAASSANIAPVSPAGEPANSGGASGSAVQYYGPRTVYMLDGSTVTASQPSTMWASAIYTMSNKASGNVLDALAIDPSTGKINTTRPVMKYGTGGNGARFNQKPAAPPLQDALDSQGSIVSAGARLFVVNAGSDTFQTFAINCTNPTILIPLGGPVKVNGNNPSTLAAARKNQVVCVATTGNVTGIECYNYQVGVDVSESTNAPTPFTNTTVSLPLPFAQSGNLPTGPPDTVSQLLFTDDERYLVAIVKGNANSNGVISGGYINMYPISTNGLGTPVKSTPAGTKLLFGCTFIYNTYNLFCADAGVGSVLLEINASTGKYAVNASTPTTAFGNGTNCWSQRSPYANGPNYIDAVDKNYIASFNKTTGAQIGGPNSEFNFQDGNPNLIEMATANNFVYALSFGNATTKAHITVARDLNLAGNFFLSQNYEIGNVDDNVSGMAAFINDPNAVTCDFT